MVQYYYMYNHRTHLLSKKLHIPTAYFDSIFFTDLTITICLFGVPQKISYQMFIRLNSGIRFATICTCLSQLLQSEVPFSSVIHMYDLTIKF